MNHDIRLMRAIALALASTALVSAAGATECADKAMQLQRAVEASSDPALANLSSALSEAKSADPMRCEQIVARVERDLAVPTNEGHASADKPIPNYPNTPKDAAGGPGFTDNGSASTGSSSMEEGHASADNPIPNQAPSQTGNGPSYKENGAKTGISTPEPSTRAGHASPEDPIPNEGDVSDHATDESNPSEQ